MGKESESTLLKDIAYKKIKDGILDELYQPGYFLSEKELVNDLDMSKTPIKSAIDRLEAEGFVNVSSKRGIIVQDISIDRINDIYNLRIALETFNCKAIYQNVSDEVLDKLKENLVLSEKAVGNLDVKNFAFTDHQFHLIIAEAADNKEIKDILLNYHDHLYRITLKHLNKDPKRMYKFHEDHVQLFKEFKNHDKKCIDSMELHLQDSKRMLFD